MTPDELAKAQAEADEPDAGPLERRRRRPRLRRQGREPLHRVRLRRFRAPRRLEDREGRRQRPLPPRLAPGPDLGPGGQSRGLRRPLQQPEGQERPVGEGRPARRRVELVPGRHDRRAASASISTTGSSSTTSSSRITGSGTSRSTRRGRSSSRPTATSSISGTSSSARSPATRPRRPWPRPRRTKGFAPLFNGRDLDGWTGDTEGYAAEDGKIVVRPELGERQPLHGEGVRRLRPPLRVQAHAGRQQRPGHPRPARRRRRLRRDGAPDPRGRLARLLGPPALPVPRLDLRRRPGPPRLPQAAGRMEHGGGHGQGPAGHRRRQRGDASSTPTSTPRAPAARSTGTNIPG
ncbi:MAG: DUF1080 domain-containing protein [Comamonadaceae bacterium]|nr:DUF1080 domain-containing protein [Comamonadaceae bacterium]